MKYCSIVDNNFVKLTHAHYWKK